MGPETTCKHILLIEPIIPTDTNTNTNTDTNTDTDTDTDTDIDTDADTDRQTPGYRCSMCTVL